ncbi:MAG: hypothetical protein HYZ44_13595 [Bacteroidetes bacterium]|nr:hypothetical protein [Bacteroidota bacterium]
MGLNFDEDFYTPRLFVIWVIGALILVFIFWFYEKSKSEEFPTLQNKDSLDEKIINFMPKGRSVYLVLTSQRKIFVIASENREYKDNSDLGPLISVGDRIIKKPYSDTLILEHLGEKYYFIHGQQIDSLKW